MSNSRAALMTQLVVGFAEELSETVQSLMPSVVQRVTQDTLKECVVGGNNSIITCGLYIGLDDISSFYRDTSFNLREFLAKHGSEEVIIPIEVRISEPVPGKKAQHYRYIIKRTKDQQICGAYILLSPQSPHNVALIPAAYLEPQPKDKDTILSSAEVFIGYKPEPFAIEYSPFVMPLHKLPDALKALRDFYQGGIEQCFNHYGDFKYEGLPRPKAHAAICLAPRNRSE